MSDRPALDCSLDSKTFGQYYYLKEELIGFCRKNGLPAGGSKGELTERIAYFLDTGKVLAPPKKSARARTVNDEVLTPESVIEQDIVCSEKHRAFFKQHLGKGFSFNVAFQKWLKANAGKTYADAISAYREIIASKKTMKTTIDKQFEYNTYIRDFFADNGNIPLEKIRHFLCAGNPRLFLCDKSPFLVSLPFPVRRDACLERVRPCFPASAGGYFCHIITS